MVWGDIPTNVFDIARGILETVRIKDPETYYHCLRVGQHARMFARDIGLNEYQQKVAEFSGILHDVGKVAVPNDIIHKPGRLTDEEMDVMKMHPVKSALIIEPFTVEQFLQQVVPGVRHHHERIDGRGYPDGIEGDEIPLYARLILIVDTYDAMTEDRSYRRGLPIEKVYEELQRCAGTQFDQQLVKMFLQAHPHWHKQGQQEHTIITLEQDSSQKQAA